MNSTLLKAEFFGGPTEEVAWSLIGKKLVRKIGPETMACRIVEAEAYLASNDSACHASVRRTARNEVMFGPSGLIYVYSIHSRFCVNIVTEREGIGCAVLIRAAMPLAGVEGMFARRRVESSRDLLNGPGKLCQALGIDRSLNGKPLVRSSGLWLVDDGCPVASNEIRVTPRIGVTSAREKLLRYVWRGSEFASGPKRLR